MKEECPACGYNGHGGLCCTKITDLSVTFGSEVILDHVCLHFHCGELTAIIGPNGAGKSTLLKALIGIVPYSGSLSYLDAKESRTHRPRFGYVPQDFQFDKDSPVSVLDFLVAARYRFPVWFHIKDSARDRTIAALKIVQASHLLHKRLGILSGGELQRVLLALALDPIPNILLLDEPMNGVDQDGIILFYQIVSDLIKEYDLSVLLVSHDLKSVRQIADRVVLLNKKVLMEDAPENVFQSQTYYSVFSSDKKRVP